VRIVGTGTQTLAAHGGGQAGGASAHVALAHKSDMRSAFIVMTAFRASRPSGFV
jgi:hypothetical protein